MKIVCVTGMHRSGTSLVGRVANLLGVHFGPEEDFMAPKPDNPAGFWENTLISGLNDDLLGALGGVWSDPPVLGDGWEADGDLDPFREQAEALIQEVLAGDDPPALAGWKDPRTSLLLPFWRTVAPIDATIMTIRDPRDVAASLASRDKMDAGDAARLWLRYVVAAWRADPQRLVVSYDAFCDDPDTEVSRIVKHLGLSEPADDIKADIDTFVDATLRHFHDDALPEGRAMATAVAVHDLLLNAETGVLDVVLESFHEGWVADREIDLLEHHITSVTAERDLAQTHRDEVIEERDLALKERDHLGTEMERDRATLSGQIADLTAQMEEERAALGTQITDLTAQMEEERASLTEQRDDLPTQMEEERAALGTQIKDLTTQMEEERAALGTQIKDLTTQMEEERAALGTQIKDLTTQMEEERAALMRQRDHWERLCNSANAFSASESNHRNRCNSPSALASNSA